MLYETDIEVQNQTARIAVPIPGTDLSLAYASRRAPGYLPPRSITVPVTDEEFDADDTLLEGVESTVLVEGTEYSASWDAEEAEPNLRHEFTWSGENAYGQPMQGGARVTGEIAHEYQGMHGSSNEIADRMSSARNGGTGPTRVVGGTFDFPSSVTLEGGRGSTTFRLTNNWATEIYAYDTSVHGLGGWTLDAHHMLFDELRPTVEYGDGSRRSLGKGVSETIDGVTPSAGGSNETCSELAIGSDGTVYTIASQEVWKIPPETIDGATEPTYWAQLEPIEFSEDSPLTFADSGALSDLAVGPDDGIYVTDNSNDCVHRIDADGIMETIAGTGESAPVPGTDHYAEHEGEPATDVALNNPGWIGVGPEGDVFFTVGDSNQEYYHILRIRTNGRLALVNHYNNPGFGTDPTKYLEDAPVRGPHPDEDGFDDEDWVHEVLGDVACMAVGPDNDIYLGEHGRVRRINAEGNVSTIAGQSSEDEQTIETGYAGDGGRATDALLGIVNAIAVDEDGYVYVATGGEGGASRDEARVIRVITPDGRIRRLAGDWTDIGREELEDEYDESRAAVMLESNHALEAYIGDAEALAAAPDGTIRLLEGAYPRGWTIYTELRSIRQSELQEVTGSLETLHVPSKDGQRVHEFDENRRHQRTQNALTGETEVEFAYDESRLISEITDAVGRTTTVERDADGTATAIISPEGTRTELQVDASGDLVGVTYPDGRTFEIGYASGNLVESFVDPAEGELGFEYDEEGRLVSVTAPTGDEESFVRTKTDDGYEVTTISAEFRERSFAVERSDEDDKTRYANTCCDDLETKTVAEPNGDRVVTYPNGVETMIGTREDPRFGTFSPYNGEVSLESPDGLEFVQTTRRSVELNDEDDVLDLSSHSETVTINGEAYKIDFDLDISFYADRDRLTITSAAGRTTTLTIEDGSPSVLELDGLEEIELTHQDGDLVEMDDGRINLSYEYDAEDNLVAIAGADGEATLSYDETGRLTSITGVDGETVAFGYDDADNVTSITTPSGETHELSYTPRGDLETYESPAGDEYELGYDGDGLVTGVELPSGGDLDYGYDTHGRRETTTLTAADGTDHGTIDLDYGADGTVSSIERTLDGTTATIEFEHDGEFPTELVYGGVAEGTFAFAYDDDLNVSEVTLPSGGVRSLAYDPDGLRTQVGPFSFDRDGPLGGTTTIADENLEIEVTYDDHGVPSMRTHRIADEVVYEAEFAYDGAGRLSQRTETVDGETVTYTYEYETGRLVGVERDGTTYEVYGYDEHGNLTSRTVDGTTAETTIGVQDQIDTHDGSEYAYDADGFLVERGDDELTYSVGGELLAVDLDGSGEVIEYAYDGFGRRVARTDAAGTTEYLYGNPNNRVELTATRSPDGTFTTYYYDDAGRLFAFERGAEWYYVATDQVGSPRAVFDSDGELVKQVTYDAFGAAEEDTDPSFDLAVGFAGGLADPATGLVRFWNRDYDPETGRWTARDPILFDGRQTNLYAYVENDPVNRLDPSGLSWDCYWDRVGRDVDAAGSPFETFLEEGIEQLSPDLARALGLGKGAYDAYDDAKGAYDARKAFKLGKGLGGAARAAGLPADLAYQAGVRAGAAINPFAEHSLGEQLGNAAYDRFN